MNDKKQPDLKIAEGGFEEVVVQVNRVSKKTQGGNQLRFSTLVVVGDKNGKVGVGLGKAQDVRSAIMKASLYAKKHLISIPLRGTTIPLSQRISYGAAQVLIKPAPAGTGIIAGGAIRVVFELAGIRDGVGKILGTKNKITNIYATMEALRKVAYLFNRYKNNIRRLK